MNVWRLVMKEIAHRRLTFALGALSVLVAVGVLVGALTLLHAHDLRTDQILAEKTTEVKRLGDKLKDDYRKMTLKFGFNLLILPKEQNLGDLYADDYASKLMPEDYVKRLANSEIMTVRHLLPILQQKLKWPERERTIILVGTRGEVPLVHRDPKKPMLTAVERGTMVMGYELHRSLGLKVGEKVKLLGREFTLAKSYDERGSKDDITIWIPLAEAQEMLDKEGRINAILALSCLCEGVQQLAAIRSDIAKILPETQVIEFHSQAVMRAEARVHAAKHARTTAEAAAKSRAELRGERELLAALIVPVVIVGCAVGIGFLAFQNVRDRRSEVGILRALGMDARRLFSVFLTRAALIGLIGGVLGYFVGLVVGMLLGETGAAGGLFDPVLLLLAVVLAPVLASIASWIPALVASQQDAAVVLRQE